MTENNNLSVLPFYTDIKKQNHRRSYAYGEVYPLYCPTNTLLPFQILRKETTAIQWVRMYTKQGTLVANLLSEMQHTGLRVLNFADYGYNIILYSAIMPMATNMMQGQYYIAVKTGAATYYSDIFTMINNAANFTKIEWYDEGDMVMDGCRIVYQNPRFINRLYFAQEIGKPEYQFDEEGEERDGFFFPAKQLSEKTYKMTVLAPEYLCDVMRFIRMADYVRVTDKYGREYHCDAFLITPKWQEQGDLASVEIEFETDTVAKKIGKLMPPNNRGDYNIDYNDDYLNS